MRNFTFAKKWHEILKDYSSEIRNEIYIACIEYFFTGTIIDMQPICRMAFDFIRHDIDERERVNAIRREKRRAAKGAQPLKPAKVETHRPTAKKTAVRTSTPEIAAETATETAKKSPEITPEKATAISALLSGLASRAAANEQKNTDTIATPTTHHSNGRVTLDRSSRFIKLSVKKPHNGAPAKKVVSGR